MGKGHKCINRSKDTKKIGTARESLGSVAYHRSFSICGITDDPFFPVMVMQERWGRYYT